MGLAIVVVLAQCWNDTCWQLILFRLETFFGVVTHLQFQGRVVNWCLLVTHQISVVWMATGPRCYVRRILFVHVRLSAISFICSMVGFDGWIEARKGCVSLVVVVFVRECACVSDLLCLGV